MSGGRVERYGPSSLGDGVVKRVEREQLRIRSMSVVEVEGCPTWREPSLTDMSRRQIEPTVGGEIPATIDAASCR